MLKDDPTGFSLLDHLVYDPPHPTSPMAAAIATVPSFRRLAQLGVERYKNVYLFLNL